MLDWKVAELREALRRAILKAFVRWGKLSPEAADTLAGWDTSREHLGGLLRYLFRSPISFKRLQYQEKTGKVRLKLKRGGHREWDHPLDFLAYLSIHVPKARQQIVTYAGYYANSTGNLNRNQEPKEESPETEQTLGARRWIPWSTLVARACTKALLRAESGPRALPKVRPPNKEDPAHTREAGAGAPPKVYRTIRVPIPPPAGSKVNYVGESCYHCNATGTCPYCTGKGVCYSCDGKGFDTGCKVCGKVLES